jgi:uncharacterized membrane protein
MKRREDLTTPRRRTRFGLHYDTESFGNFAESIARTLGTARFLVFQTVIVVIWIFINVTVVVLRWDPYPFILLNLAFSTQAAYAAPLILLAQNRQETRDRSQTDMDRRVAERTQVDTEFLAREIASVRRSLGDVATSSELDDQLERLTSSIERMSAQLAAIEQRIQPA